MGSSLRQQQPHELSMHVLARPSDASPYTVELLKLHSQKETI